MNYGIIRISKRMVEDESESVAEAFAYLGFVPDAITDDFSTHSFHYRGKSKQFPIKVQEGNIIPFYTINFHKKGEKIAYTLVY